MEVKVKVKVVPAGHSDTYADRTYTNSGGIDPQICSPCYGSARHDHAFLFDQPTLACLQAPGSRELQVAQGVRYKECVFVSVEHRVAVAIEALSDAWRTDIEKRVRATDPKYFGESGGSWFNRKGVHRGPLDRAAGRAADTVHIIP